MSEGSKFVDTRTEQRLRFGKNLQCAIAGNELRHLTEFQVCGEQRLAQIVVEIAGDASTFLLLHMQYLAGKKFSLLCGKSPINK